MPLTPAWMCIRKPYLAYAGHIEKLHQCLGSTGITLHSGRNLVKAVTISAPTGGSIEVVVKSFKVPPWPQRFIYRRIRPSKARRSIEYANKLLEMGINTPEPVASIEYEAAACLRESYYICRHWPADVDLTALLYGRGSPLEASDNLLEQLARFTSKQHDLGVLHLDYNPGNILTRRSKSDYDFALVDLNRLRFGNLDTDGRLSGLVRLTNSVDYLMILGRAYARCHGADPMSFCRRLERAYNRFWARRRAMNRVKSVIRNER